MRWVGTDVEVVEKADGVLPFKRDVFELEPALVRLHGVGSYQVRLEKSIQARKEEREI